MFCKSTCRTFVIISLVFCSLAQAQEHALFNLYGDYGRRDPNENFVEREEMYTYGDALYRSALQTVAATAATGVSTVLVHRLTRPIEISVTQNRPRLNSVPGTVRQFVLEHGINSPLGRAFDRNAGQILVLDNRGQQISEYRFTIADGRSEDLGRAYMSAFEAAERLGERTEIRLSLRTESRVENFARRFGRNRVLQVASFGSLGLLYVGMGSITYRLFTDSNGVACLRLINPPGASADNSIEREGRLTRLRGELEADCVPASLFTSILFGVDYQGILPSIR